MRLVGWWDVCVVCLCVAGMTVSWIRCGLCVEWFGVVRFDVLCLFVCGCVRVMCVCCVVGG